MSLTLIDERELRKLVEIRDRVRALFALADRIERGDPDDEYERYREAVEELRELVSK